MANKSYNLVFKANMETSGVKSSIAELDKMLESTSMKLPKNISNNLTKLIKTLKSELGKIEGFEGAELDAKGAKQISASYDKINSAL